MEAQVTDLACYPAAEEHRALRQHLLVLWRRMPINREQPLILPLEEPLPKWHQRHSPSRQEHERHLPYPLILCSAGHSHCPPHQLLIVLYQLHGLVTIHPIGSAAIMRGSQKLKLLVGEQY